MPFDQLDFKIETKPDVFSLEALIAWLEKQAPETTYDYTQPATCLWGRYVESCGGSYMGYYRIGDKEEPVTFGAAEGEYPWQRVVAQGRPNDLIRGWTFGAALTRARKLLEAKS